MNKNVFLLGYELHLGAFDACVVYVAQFFYDVA